MSSDNRIFPPSDHKLSELRKRGFFPFSHDLKNAGTFIGIACALAWASSGGVMELKEIATLSFQGEIERAKLLGFISRSTFLLALVPAVLSLLVGLLQSRFFFRFAPLAFWQSVKARRAGIGRRTVSELFFSAIFVAAAIFVLQMQQERLGFYPKELNVDGLVSSLVMVRSSLMTLIYVAAGLASLLGGVAFVTIVWEFRSEQRMSREELEAEARELDTKPEVKFALRTRIEEGD